MSRNLRNRILLLTWITYAVALFTATHIPVPLLIENVVSMFDKMLHAMAFFILAMLTFLVLGWRDRLQPPSLGILAALISWAGLDEYLQGFVNRYPDVTDWIADSIGIVIAFLLTHWIAARNREAAEPLTGSNQKLNPE